MKAAWLALLVICFSLIVVTFLVLPDRLFDLPGLPELSGKVRLLGLLSFLIGSINFLVFVYSRLPADGKIIRRLTLPNKSYWLETEGRRTELAKRVKDLMYSLGAYVNFLSGSSFYMLIHYYYPDRVYCPRHRLMMLIWAVLSIAVLAYGVTRFRRNALS